MSYLLDEIMSPCFYDFGEQVIEYLLNEEGCPKKNC